MKDYKEMSYSDFCELISDDIDENLDLFLDCSSNGFLIYHDKKENRYFYLEYVEEGDAGEFFELDLVATLEHHRRFDSNYSQLEYLFESDCGGYVSVDNNHIRYYWFKKKEYFEWCDIVKLPDGQIVAERHPISGIMDADAIYQIDDFYDAVASKYGVEADDIQTYMMDNIDFDPATLPWGAAECGCYVDGIPEESLEEWGFDGLGWTCSYCGEYYEKGKANPMKPNLPVCPHCKSRMNIW
ncbi:MAG: hypothetical protein IJ341_02690 [Bacteroidales bacterium]|nr:hypothetical protein [Bacteroidales bacterium]